MSKPREFYLYTMSRGVFSGLENERTWDDDIHVIEKSAADRLADALFVIQGEERHSTAGKRYEIIQQALEEYRG